MSFEMRTLLASFALLVGMFVLLEVGRRLGRRRVQIDPEGARAGVGAVEASVFGLFGLLIAFSFSGATSRFDDRRHLVVDEANAIGTAYLRIDLLPTELQPKVRQEFRTYVDSRIEIYKAVPDMSKVEAALDRSNRIQSQLWTDAVKAAEGSQPATMLLLPAMNDMIDITTVRTMATTLHPPEIIFALLFILALGSALLVGYSMAVAKTRSWVHTIAFAVIVSLTIHIILDIEHPRLGLIRVDDTDQVLIQLRDSMN